MQRHKINVTTKRSQTCTIFKVCRKNEEKFELKCTEYFKPGGTNSVHNGTRQTEALEVRK